MTGNKGKSVLPPSSINVQKFAEARNTEIEALYSIVKDRLNNDFRSQRKKRRRTTGHDNRPGQNKIHRKRQRLEEADPSGNISRNNEESRMGENKILSRRIRRRIELKKNHESGFTRSGDGTKRLRTHVWHAKRFSMTKLWGFHLPLGLQGRGRGSRALLKRAREGVLLHDASYFSVVQLEGSQEAILSILSMVLTPSPTSYADVLSTSFVSGAIHRNAMLHHVGFPLPRAIAPVIYMWQPFSHDYTTNDEHLTSCNPTCMRQLWVWIHASAFTEGYSSINSACQELRKDADVSINCCSLEGQLAKLELIGPRALQLLQKILIPVTNVVEKSSLLRKCSLLEQPGRQDCARMFLEKKSEDHIPPCTVIPLFVCDPRTLMENNSKIDTGLISTKSNNTREEDGRGKEDYTGLAEMSKKYIELPTSISKLEENDYESLAVNLWDIGKGRIHPPLETCILDKEKHDQKLARYGLGKGSFDTHSSSSEIKFDRFCPILLLNDATQMGPSERWSIILPLSWVRAFWLPLISKGAHAIGLRERQWITSEVGLPSFPSDFPDCNAYSQYIATKAAVSDEKVRLRPPALRPLLVPPSPPWESIRFAFDGKSIEKEYVQAYTENNHGILTEWFVARTSSSLTHFLTENHDDHMLLFPHGHNGINDITKTMREHGKTDSSLLESRRLSSIKEGKMCFVRVLLHAYKEGVFEDGSIVCAANVPDINLWLERDENQEGEIQISQSLVSSYFKQQSCGKWEVQLPEDHEARKFHRWPIGFVTSGFVQGSKKGVAIGLCEARLLGYTREAQWNEMAVDKRRKEIFVLVRNIRSTAYRLGLATLILEQQDYDSI